MPKITAVPCPKGVHLPFSDCLSERDITEDLPPNIIGECVAEATNLAWNKGYDPTVPPFVVLVTFS